LAGDDAGANSPQRQSSLLPRARVFEGLWSEFFRVEPALHDAGIPSTFVSISALPKDDIGLNGDSVIVLVNTAAPHLTAPRVARIKEFVAAGGGLVVLAGQSAFSRGGYTNSLLAEMLPVTFPAEGILWPIPGGLALARAPAATWVPPVDFSAQPRTFFLEAFTPKPGSVVQLLAGDKPAIISGTFGKGRVVAIAVMVNGEAGPGQLAFWDWPQWPRLLGQAIDWAAAGRPLNGAAGNAVSLFKPLTVDETKDLSLGLKHPENFLARARAHPTAEIAQGLFDIALARDVASKITFSQILPIVLPFAKAEWGPRLAERTVMNADREDRDAALVLLGATRWPGAAPHLLRALSQPDTKVAAIEGLGRCGDPSVIPQLRQVYDATIRATLLPGEREWFNPHEFAQTGAPAAAEAALALYRLGDPGALEKVLTMHRRVKLYWRIYHVAGRRNIKWEDPKQVSELHSIWDQERRLAGTLEKLERHADPLPASQLPEFLSSAQGATDPVDVEWLMGEMERSLTTVAPGTWQPLAAAKDGIIARLARTATETKR
jgi:uncharacterized membrane protein